MFKFVNIGLLPKRNYSEGTKVTSNSGVVEDDVKDSKEGEERVKGTNVQESTYDKKKDIITVYKVEREDVIDDNIKMSDNILPSWEPENY